MAAQPTHSAVDHGWEMELPIFLSTAASTLLVILGVAVVAVLAIVPTVLDPAG